MSSPTTFPPNFTWGAATASYQIEGAADVDGKGPSVWDMFGRTPGKVWEGQSGVVACDHYHRFQEDVDLMADLKLGAYRFSLSWPRILPEGTGAVNRSGLDFYDRLVDALLARGIQPWVTLFHWDLPYALYLRGGWLNRDSADWFADYARVVVDRLSDRVTNWMTLNEPQCFIGLALEKGEHAPGDKLGRREVLTAGHHALLAHGRAVGVLRAHAKTPARIGWAPVGVVAVPATESAADIAAARSVMFDMRHAGTWNNPWWGDPVVLGRYPEDGWKVLGADVPPVRDGDLAEMSRPLDFYGANIYNAQTFRAGSDGLPEQVKMPDGYPHSLFLWKCTPGALYWGPRLLHERYGLPIVVTENGMSCHDWVGLDGVCHDPQRVDFLERYLSELRRAANDGVPVEGYFLWSLLDNFEWAEGYKQRFGIIHVDYATQRRTPKDSARWYRRVIETNGASVNPEGRAVERFGE